MRRELEQFFKNLESELGISLSVEWRRQEALVQIEIEEDFYVFLVFSWHGGECSVEYMVGDDNAIIQSRHVDKLDLATSIVKQIHKAALEKFTCLSS